MIAERNPDVRGAANMLYRLSEDSEVWAQLEYRDKARGEAQSRAEIARNLKSLDLPLDVIEKATDLRPEAIQQL